MCPNHAVVLACGLDESGPEEATASDDEQGRHLFEILLREESHVPEEPTTDYEESEDGGSKPIHRHHDSTMPRNRAITSWMPACNVVLALKPSASNLDPSTSYESWFRDGVSVVTTCVSGMTVRIAATIALMSAFSPTTLNVPPSRVAA